MKIVIQTNEYLVYNLMEILEIWVIKFGCNKLAK